MPGLLAAALLASGLLSEPAAWPMAHPVAAGECRFETLPAELRRRYRSRYQRRLRNQGEAAAQAWLRGTACATPEERAARRAPHGRDGRPCTRTRMEMRATPGFGGAVTMSPVPVCAE